MRYCRPKTVPWALQKYLRRLTTIITMSCNDATYSNINHELSNHPLDRRNSFEPLRSFSLLINRSLLSLNVQRRHWERFAFLRVLSVSVILQARWPLTISTGTIRRFYMSFMCRFIFSFVFIRPSTNMKNIMLAKSAAISRHQCKFGWKPFMGSRNKS
jgi:hypothetical protein